MVAYSKTGGWGQTPWPAPPTRCCPPRIRPLRAELEPLSWGKLSGSSERPAASGREASRGRTLASLPSSSRFSNAECHPPPPSTAQASSKNVNSARTGQTQEHRPETVPGQASKFAEQSNNTKPTQTQGHWANVRSQRCYIGNHASTQAIQDRAPYSGP